MVSRSTGPLRKILPAVAVGLAAALVGCGVGQVTQTDTMEPAVNGNRGDVGDIALRDVVLAYPDTGAYDEGDDAPLVLAIVNTGNTDDELVSVTSPAIRGEAEFRGNPRIPAGTSLQVIVPTEDETSSPAPSTTGTSIPDESVTEPSPPAATGTETPSDSSVPSAPESADSTVTETPTSPPLEEIGTMSVVLPGLVMDIPIARNIPVTFVFAEAGEITINVPIATPTTARPDPPDDEEEAGH